MRQWQAGSKLVPGVVYLTVTTLVSVRVRLPVSAYSVAEKAPVDFTFGKQRDRKSTAQKGGRGREGKPTSPGNFPTLSEKQWTNTGTRTEAKRKDLT